MCFQFNGKRESIGNVTTLLYSSTAKCPLGWAPGIVSFSGERLRVLAPYTRANNPRPQHPVCSRWLRKNSVLLPLVGLTHAEG